jgi:hypothetical protein
MIDKLSKIICDWHIDIINDAVKMSLSQLLMIFIYLFNHLKTVNAEYGNKINKYHQQLRQAHLNSIINYVNVSITNYLTQFVNHKLSSSLCQS